jgi:hypothetical protein
MKRVLGLSFASIFVWNECEPYRLAKSIKNGSQFVRFQSKDRISHELFPVSLEEIKRRMNFSRIIGIVGTKSTGKSVILTALGNQLENVVKFTLNSSNYRVGLTEAILFEMRQQIYTLPWPFTRIRLSSIDSDKIVANAFQKLRHNTGIPVTLLLDIDNPAINCEDLIREIKMVCDDELVYCIFAASENLNFQVEAHRERRLMLFYSSELSIEASTAFLKQSEKIENFEVSDLYCFPRIFSNLHNFGESRDKKAFVDEFTESCRVSLQKLSSEQRDLLQMALSQAVDMNDYKNCKLTERQVMDMVDLNILTQTSTGKFKIKFDVWRQAIEKFPN